MSEIRRPHDAKEEARNTLKAFGVQGSDLQFATQLYHQYLTATGGTTRIGPDGFIPSAFLSAEQRQQIFGVVHYSDIKEHPNYRDIAKEVVVTIHPMDGGIGSSVSRLSNLQRRWKSLERTGEAYVGSKSTDLFFDVPIPETSRSVPVCIMEIKFLRMLQEAGKYKTVNLQPLLNKDSEPSFLRFLESTIFFDRAQDSIGNTYRDLLATQEQVVLLPSIIQADLPTIDRETQQLTLDRVAPGGHGQIGTYLLDGFSRTLPEDNTPRIHAIYNGDGPNNSVSPEMVGFVASEGVGIAMITTTRRSDDKKVGLIGAKEKNGAYVPDIFELSQAKKVKQTALFDATGVRHTPETTAVGLEHTVGEQYSNTNIALLNETLLAQFLGRMRAYLGPEKFAEVITPELNENEKRQNGKSYTQLEGPLGSAILRLNAFVLSNEYAQNVWSEISGGTQFLRIINLDDPIDRDDHFTPNKYTFDWLLQARTGHYVLDTNVWKIRNTKPGHAFHVSSSLVEDTVHYNDVENLLRAFDGVDLLDLDELVFERGEINGEKAKGFVALQNSILKGKVLIRVNHDTEIDLQSPIARSQMNFSEDEALVLENVEITIEPTGDIVIRTLDTE